MDRINHQKDFRDALQSLETCLETPRVSGELERWFVDVQRNVELISKLLAKQLDRQHPPRLRQIAVEDPELNAQVARLKSGDDESREQFVRLREWTDRLAKKAPKVEPDEERIEEDVVEFIAFGLAFIIHARKQEIALETWLHESLYRDTGGSG
jgi:hypothetical protein